MIYGNSLPLGLLLFRQWEFDNPEVTDTPVTRGFSTEMEKCLQGGERGDGMGWGEKNGAECTLVSAPGKTAGP